VLSAVFAVRVLKGGVDCVQSKGLHLQVSLPWDIGEAILHGHLWALVLVAIADTSTRSFIHVKPNSIKGELIVEGLQIVLPPGDGFGLEEVGVVGVAWPHTASCWP
jgi:hypothetical protein